MSKNLVDSLKFNCAGKFVKSSLRLYLNSGILTAFALLIPYQFVTFFSAYLTVNLVKSSKNASSLLQIIPLYFVSFIALRIVLSLSTIALERGRLHSTRAYIEKFTSVLFQNPHLFVESKARLKLESWLTADANITISEGAYYFHGLAFCGATFISSVTAISIFGDIRFLVSYVVSVLCAFAVTIFSRRKMIRTSMKEQDCRREMNTVLTVAWENTATGNSGNMTSWNRIYFSKWKNSLQASTRLHTLEGLTSTLLQAVVLLPVASVFLSILLSGEKSSSQLAALVGLVFSHLEALTALESLTSRLISLAPMRYRLKDLFEALSSIENRAHFRSLEVRISWDDLVFSHQGRLQRFEKFDDFFEWCSLVERGRIRITGRNGAGKSTILALAKYKFGDKALWIPATGTFMYEQDSSNITNTRESGSSGESAVKYLSMILEQQGQQTLLLDEWSAHTDLSNSLKLNTMLEQTSQNRLVIEIVHGNFSS